jgi:hypothetical protein
LQGKAELVTPDDLIALLQGLYRDKRALWRRHERGAKYVSDYDANNTYQFILNRDTAHLDWLEAAMESLGAEPGESAADLPLPGGGKAGPVASAVLDDDVRTARAFTEQWNPKVAVVSHQRHRRMLELMLGEVREQQRFFEQGLAGSTDLLGRRPAGAGTGGGVLATRWIE